ncbi:hypothetical protein H0E87_024559 [Populus deltoides]|uniref:FAM192A/Fyv6 N-terminal domain-containing protein n=1 Tax=Populus deltoides TaxID=3696 RepID=A0A8T2XAC1_POPDE|nr:hypothetical protein H0E87_024559 [Populus deltoides]
MEEELRLPVRLMNFVSEEQLDEAKKSRGERVEDGTAQRDRPLFEILKENKDKKDAEFNERLKHRPPKALDEDETEFLDNLEMSKKEYEQQIADEEARQLRSFQLLLFCFQAAVAAQSFSVDDLKETPLVPPVPEQKSIGRKNPAARPLSMIIKVKPQAKKAKMDQGNVEEHLEIGKTPDVNMEKSSDTVKVPSNDVAKTGLVSYSDESEDDD